MHKPLDELNEHLFPENCALIHLQIVVKLSWKTINNRHQFFHS